MALPALHAGSNAGTVPQVSGPPLWASNYVGIPFSARGHDRRGVHCWGLVWIVYRELLGITLHRDDTVDGSDLMRFSSLLGMHVVDLPLWSDVTGPPRDFDLVLMTAVVRADGMLRRVAAHVGIIAGEYILHAQLGSDSVCQPTAALMRRIVGTYRYDAATSMA